MKFNFESSSLFEFGALDPSLRQQDGKTGMIARSSFIIGFIDPFK
jgi:hypothetical protein